MTYPDKDPRFLRPAALEQGSYHSKERPLQHIWWDGKLFAKRQVLYRQVLSHIRNKFPAGKKINKCSYPLCR